MGKHNWQDRGISDRHVSFPLMARLRLFEKMRRKVNQEFSLRTKKALEDYHYKVDLIKSEMQAEREAIHKLREELEKEVRQEIGEQYSLNDICLYSGKILRNKESGKNRSSQNR